MNTSDIADPGAGDDEVVRLQRRLRQLEERMRVSSEALRDFAAADDSEKLLALVARRLSEVFGGDLCVVRRIAFDGVSLEPAGGVHHPDPALATLVRDNMISVQQQRLGMGISGRVVATGVPALIPSVTADELAAAGTPRAVVERLGDSSLLVVPLSFHGRVIGVLTLARPAGLPHDEDDLQLAQDLAVHAAVALAHCQLIEASRRELAERVHSEEELRRGFLEAAPDAVLIVDERGRIVLVNSQAEALFGYSRGELLWLPIEALVPDRFRPSHAQHRHLYLGAPLARPMSAGLDIYARRKDGVEFAAEISLSPISTPNGTLVAAAIRDVTERKRDMEERNRRMKEANRLKSEFLANMSHELRTPLNAIIGFAALMHGGKAGPMSEVHKEYLGDILGSSRHLLQLINDILDLSKVEAGRMDLRLESVDLVRTVSEVKEILRGLAAEKRIALQLAVDGRLGEVVVDSRKLKQILYNFLSNAIKFTPDGGQVSLRVAPDGDDDYRVEVEDTGIGIQPEDMSRLFIEFQQLDAGKAKRYPGTGLGLALTKRLVEAHGGNVSVVSTPGHGSTFTAVMPREAKPARVRTTTGDLAHSERDAR